MRKLDHEGLRQRLPLIRDEHDGDQFDRHTAYAKQTVGQTVGPLSLGPAIGDLSREASEILDQDDPQRDRYGPEFPDV